MFREIGHGWTQSRWGLVFYCGWVPVGVVVQVLFGNPALRAALMVLPSVVFIVAPPISENSQSAALEWRMLPRAQETDRYFVIWGQSGSPMIVPKKQLTAEETTSLRNILQLYIASGLKQL